MRDKNVKLTISDNSEKALAIAKDNCYKNYVDATAINSDLFENIEGEFEVEIDDSITQNFTKGR